jgi:hypothetical protein
VVSETFFAVWQDATQFQNRSGARIRRALAPSAAPRCGHATRLLRD